MVDSNTAKEIGYLIAELANGQYDERADDLTGIVDGENISPKSIDADAFNNDTDILEIGPSGALIHRRDPSSSTTPVEDALANVDAAGGGTVILPPRTVQNAGPLSDHRGVTLKGHGYLTSVVEISGDGNNGIEATNGAGAMRFEGFRLSHANGVTGNTGSALYLGSTLSSSTFKQVRFSQWNGNDCIIDGDFSDARTGNPFQITFDEVDIRSCDAEGGTLVRIDECGPRWTFRDCTVSPSDASSGQDSSIFWFRGVNTINVTGLNVGGTAGRLVENRANSVAFDGWSYEPSSSNSTTTHVIVNRSFASEYKAGRIGAAADYDYVYQDEIGGCHFSEPRQDTFTNTNILEITDVPNHTGFYYGDSEDVDNSTGSVLSEPIHCLSDGVFKASTGTGYDGGTNDTKYGP